jgi:putative NADPH-quinone reductase
MLKGRSARIIVTRGMPELFDEVDRTPRNLRRVAAEVLALCGVRPVRVTVIEGAETLTDAQRENVRFDIRRLGHVAR